MNLAPRFTNLQAQLKHLCCGPGQGRYSDFLIQPVGQIDRNLIASEKDNMDHIAAGVGATETAIHEIARSAEAVAAKADDLQGVTGRFQTG